MAPRRPLLLGAAALVALAACSGSSSGTTASTSGSPAPASASAAGATTAGATTDGRGTTTGAGGSTTGATTTAAPGTSAVPVVPGMPAVVDASNIYSEIAPGKMSPAVANDKTLVYVPHNFDSNTWVIDPATKKVIGKFPTGRLSQHVVPSWDLSTLYVTASGQNGLVPVDPATGQPGALVPVAAPYNLYFGPDGKSGIVMAERLNRIDFYDPHTWKLQSSLPVPCRGINHADWSVDGSYFLATCEFTGELLKIDTETHQILGELSLPLKGSMPQDLRAGPDGKTFFVADMMADGVWVIDGPSFTVKTKIPTGVGAHGIYPSRDGSILYVSNRGRHGDEGGRPSRTGEGSISLLDPRTLEVTATWEIPGGGSPDMGGLNADGTELWLSGRYDDVVYVFDTRTGAITNRIPVGKGPHGLAIFPQPGRYSLGHTGNFR